MRGLGLSVRVLELGAVVIMRVFDLLIPKFAVVNLSDWGWVAGEEFPLE